MARYTNVGMKDTLFSSGDTITNNYTVSHTGRAVAWCNPSAFTALSDLGLTGITELWIRLDVYLYKPSNGSIYVRFDSGANNTGGNTDGTYIWLNGVEYSMGHNWGIGGQVITKVVMHVSPSVLEVYTDDVKVVDYSGLSLGTNITDIRIQTGNSRYSNIIIADYDCSQESLANITETLHADTRRTLAGMAVLHGDTSRILTAPIVAMLHGDTVRTLTAGTVARLHADTRRVLSGDMAIHADTRRVLTSDARLVSLSADTRRTVAVETMLHGDTARAVTSAITIHADAERALPFVVDIQAGTGGLNNVTMTLAEKTLSDTFRMMSATPYNLQDVIMGAFFNFGFQFRVESTSQRDLMQTVTGTYDVDELLYNPIKYHVPPEQKSPYYPKKTSGQDGQKVIYGVTAAQIAGLCCEGINKTAVCMFDDFYPTSAQDDVITNYSSVLSGVFGWTAQVPRKQINVFIRGDAVYFLQRGYEQGVIDLDAYTHSRPTFDRSLVRTMWARRADFYDQMSGSTGIWGDWYIESISDPDINHGGHGTTPPDVTLDSDGLVERTVERVETDDGERVITTDYEYTSTGRSKFLTREIQTTTENGETVEQRTIDHYPLENGQRYSVGRDGNGNTSSGLGTYPFSDSMNKYSGEVWQLTRGGRWVTNNGDTIADSNSFPVNDRNTIEAIYTELKWMNRKTMERVTVDIIGTEINGVSSVGRVFDFFSRYELGGNEYFLVSNTVSYTARQFIQTLNLVRWY